MPTFNEQPKIVRDAIEALRAVVDANKRYTELTQRKQDAVALHPTHAMHLLMLLDRAYEDTEGI